MAAETLIPRTTLVETCLPCHGGDKTESGLRVDSLESLLTGGDRGAALEPGNADQSLLVQAIKRVDDDLQMPPGKGLPDSVVSDFMEWVNSGANWPADVELVDNYHARSRAHWAFQPLSDPAVPAVQNSAWPISPIDCFILAKLEAQQVAPEKTAAKHTLLRRATYDLTGLPPTPQEIEDFLLDESPTAFEHVVDRLLASPAYGERWARHWLDVVRYADYHDANPQTRTASCEITEAWRYRDWVAHAFNTDLSYDQFIVHQIAGDLLPNPTGQDFYPEGLIATTFLSNGVCAGMFYSSHILKELGAKGGEYTVNRVPLVSPHIAAQREQQDRALSEIEAKLTEFDKQTPPVPPEDAERVALVARRDALKGELLPEPPLAMAIQEGGTPGGLFPNIQDVPLHIRGSYARLGPIVPRRLPIFFVGDIQPPIQSGSGRRELANWIAAQANPLTARVIVNRVWYWHFGEGLVRTPNNFGMLSESPSHPELLDWLAQSFIHDGWSIKKLHRRMMLTATYQQTSAVSADLVAQDPDNRLFGRYVPRRLEAEAIRDSLLVAADRLDRTMGGPAADDLTTPRRSLYVQTARWDRSNYATLFDAANPDASVEKRTISIVAPQSLFLLNHEFAHTQSKHFAERLVGDELTRIQSAFRILFGRAPTMDEIRVCQELLRQSSEATRWFDLVHVLLCTNEFAYVD